MKPTKKEIVLSRAKKVLKSKQWGVLHWLTGELKMIGSEKEAREWIKRSNYNPSSPIFYAFPIGGIMLHYVVDKRTKSKRG